MMVGRLSPVPFKGPRFHFSVSKIGKVRLQLIWDILQVSRFGQLGCGLIAFVNWNGHKGNSPKPGLKFDLFEEI